MLSLVILSLAGCDLLAGTDPAGDGTVGEENSTADKDDDGDGLTNGEEEDLGTDPSSADSDADGIEDADEEDLGTDPLKADTDGDSYNDADEVATGHDPTDGDDKIYQGGWPYNPNKDDIEDPGWDGKHAREGLIVPRLITYDVNGDAFDLYDMAGHDVPVIIDISAEWCSWCMELASFMGGKSSVFDDYTASYPELEIVRDMIANGDLIWVEILDQNQSGELIEANDLKQWERKFEIEHSPLIADEEQLMIQWTRGAGYPTLILADSNMEVLSFDSRDYFGALGAAAELAPAE